MLIAFSWQDDLTWPKHRHVLNDGDFYRKGQCTQHLFNARTELLRKAGKVNSAVMYRPRNSGAPSTVPRKRCSGSIVVVQLEAFCRGFLVFRFI